MTILNAMGVHNNVSKVQWPSGVFIIVDVRADYIDVFFPLRTGDIFVKSDLGDVPEISVPGQPAPVLAQRNIQEPLTGSHAQRLRFLAVIKVKKLPKAPNTNVFDITLRGAARKTTMGSPFSTTYFCGTTTISGTISYKLVAIPSAPGNFRLVATVVWNSSTPAGSSAATWDYDVAGIGLEEARAKYDGKSFSFGDSSQQAWYQDAVTGIFHNAQFPCSEIPLSGDPVQSTVFEGFKSITVQVVASAGMKVTNPLSWTGDTIIDDILIPDPDKDTFDGRRLSRTNIGRIFAGETEDHLPRYDDLPNGVYSFNLERDTFKNIPPTPKVLLSDPDPPPFKQVIAWPTTILTCRYRLAPVQGPKPDFLDYFMPEDLDDPADWSRKIPAGLAPPSNQVFST